MKIIIKPVKPLLVLYSALNYNGYDIENNSSGMHPLRIWMRKYLKDKQIEKETEKALEPYRGLVKKVIDKIDGVFDMEKTKGDILFTVNLLESYKEKLP